MLTSIQEAQLRDSLDADWAALRGYLQISPDGVRWRWDSGNAQEEFVVERLRRVFLLTDREGKIIDISPAYRVIGPDTPAEIAAALRSREPVWTTRRTSLGNIYLIRSGMFSEDGERRYYVALGRSLALNEALVQDFTLRYIATLPVIVFVGGLLGWLLTKRRDAASSGRGSDLRIDHRR